MLDKKVTRKQFLLSIASAAAILVAGKIPEAAKKIARAERDEHNAYGNHAYGGKRNA